MITPEFRTIRNLAAVSVLLISPLAGCGTRTEKNSGCLPNSHPGITKEFDLTCKSTEKAKFERILEEVEKECSDVRHTEIYYADRFTSKIETSTYDCLKRLQSQNKYLNYE